MDIQHLIMETKAMVTDYSSIYIDYLLLDMPLLFYCYDYEKYLAEDRELYFRYEDVTPGLKARNFDELLKELVLFAVNKGGYAVEERKRARDFFYCKKGQKAVGGDIIRMMLKREFGYKKILRR